MIATVPHAAPDLSESMMAIHEGLNRLFRTHRLALMTGNLRRARSMFERYSDALRAHAADEEELLLPIFAARGGEDLDSPPRLFLGEHDKFRQFLAEAEGRLSQLEEGDQQSILDLLDREAWFINLLEHHDLREERVLYPRVQEWTTRTEWEAIYARLHLQESPE